MLKYFLLAITIISSTVSAQKADTSYNLLDTAIITSRSIKVKSKENPSIISSIDKQEIIQKGARTTPEALIGVAGVYLQKTNHGGGSAFIRGLTGNQTLILVDGIRLNNATYRYGPNQYLNTIDMFTIDKIDILKGIGAIEYGSDAMGGVIHLRTKEASANSLHKINLSNTSKFISGDMEKTNRTDISYSNSKWEFLGGASFKNYGDLVAAAPIGKQSPTGYTERNYDLKAKLKINKQNEITIASQNTNQFDVPIYHKIKLENYKINQIDRQVHNLNYIKYKYTSAKKWISEITIIGSAQRSIEQRSNQKNNSTIFRKEADTINNVGFTSEIISKPTKFWTMNTGFDYYKDLV
jgi:outer membrane cobalamin receptor